MTVAAASASRLLPRYPPAPTVAAATGSGLSPAQIEAELAAVPEPQRKIAAMLPLSGSAARMDGRQIG